MSDGCWARTLPLIRIPPISNQAEVICLIPRGLDIAASLLVEQIQFGTQTAALISPNSRAILRQDAPESSVTYTSPNRLNATMRLASAGCVARPHRVPLGWVGSGRISQLSPKL